MRLFLLFILFLFLTTPILAQEKTNQNPQHISIGFGFTDASINSWQESSTGLLNPGIRALMDFKLKGVFQIEAATNLFLIHNSAPSFDNIHAWNAEINGMLAIPLNNGNRYFKFILGMTYLDWKGIYSGRGLIGRMPYATGDVIHSTFLEGNIGMGFTQQIGKRSFIDLDLRMRFSTYQNKFGQTDTSFQLAYRYAPSLHKKEKSDSEKIADANSKTKKPENGIPRGKYKWLKKKR
jgi:hypothetical protein